MNLDPAFRQRGEPVANPMQREYPDLTLLRSLLLEADRAESEAKSAQFEAGLKDRVRRDELLAAISEHLAAAFRNAEERDPKSLARALSPAVVKSIRHEISNSKDEMVEVLYPLTGRLVRAAVGDAVEKLTADVNARLNIMTSPAMISAHIKSFVFRKPASTFLLSNINKQLVFKNALLVERATGALLHAWQADSETTDSGLTAKGLASILSALSAFTEQNYTVPGSELRTLDLNGNTILLRQSPRHLLALEVEGEANAKLRSHADAIFDQMLDNLDNVDVLTTLDVLGSLPGDTVPKAQNTTLLKNISIAALVVFVAFGGWSAWDRIWFGNKVESARAYLEIAAPNHLPLLTTDRSTRTITITGPVPSEFNVGPLVQNMSSEGIRVVANVVQVTNASDFKALKTDNSLAIDLLMKQLDSIQVEIASLKQEQQASRSLLKTDLKQSELSVRADIQTERLSYDDRFSKIEKAASAANENFSAISRQSQEGQAAAELNFSALDSEVSRVSGLEADVEKRLETLSVSLETLRGLSGSFERDMNMRIKERIEAVSVVFDRADSPVDRDRVSAQLGETAALFSLTNASIEIAGYSDTTGNEDTNRSVALLRINWVKDQLVALGIGSDRIKVNIVGAVPDANGNIIRQVRFSLIENGN